jgi:hypothetical protein
MGLPGEVARAANLAEVTEVLGHLGPLVAKPVALLWWVAAD